MTDPVGPVVVAVDEQRDVAIDIDRWRDLAAATLRHEGLGHGELNLLFVDETEMQGLNTAHMGEARPTDVLSFPLDGAAIDDVPASDALIGDVVVCPGYASRQAPAHVSPGAHGGSLEDELALLVVHGARDVRVVRAHSDRIVAAARQSGADVKYIIFDDEGHAIRKWQNKITLAHAVERFLAKHLGGRAGAAREPEDVAQLPTSQGAGKSVQVAN